MPSFSQSQTPSVVQPSPEQGTAPSSALNFQTALGNSDRVARLFGLGNQIKSSMPDLQQAFPNIDSGGGASVALLAGAVAPAPAGPQAEETANTQAAPKAGTLAAEVYAGHQKQTANMSSKLSSAQLEDLELFAANWKKNKARYEAVAAKANVPAPLVAAIHWRESTGDFSTYLHQGDPLGKAAVHVPKDIPIFTKWEDAAVHALTMSDKKQTRDDLGMNSQTKDTAALATYAECYNGLGYHNHDRASPYVYSGTDKYSKGKYVSDGHYSKNTVDQQLGVMTMLGAIDGMDKKIDKAPVVGLTGWESVKAGRTLKRGARGPLVKELQDRLAKVGFACGDDGSFGPTVEKTVRAYQKANNLTEDGIVGSEMAKKLDPPQDKPTVPPAT